MTEPFTPEETDRCDHICLKDDGHVARGEPHFYGYEVPSPRNLFARLAEAEARLARAEAVIKAAEFVRHESSCASVTWAHLVLEGHRHDEKPPCNCWRHDLDDALVAYHSETENKMSKFRKRPVEVEAVQFVPGPRLSNGRLRGDNDHEINLFVPGDLVLWSTDGCPCIVTLGGLMRTEPGDWIIRGIKGEFYPCKPDIFEATYEAVE
jgi:hypothetical protein